MFFVNPIFWGPFFWLMMLMVFPNVFVRSCSRFKHMGFGKVL